MKAVATAGLLFALRALALASADAVELRSGAQVFLVRPQALVASEWENRLSGATLRFDAGSELEVEVGERPEQARQVSLQLAGAAAVSASVDRAVLRLRSEDGVLAGAITYQLGPEPDILRKFVELTNISAAPLRLLNVVLGRYPAPAKAEAPERGFPLYLEGQFFLSLAHPAGFARLEQGQAVLRQYPGARLAPGAGFACMEAVYGVARPGEIRATFLRHVQGRMRRALRGHDRPYAVLEAFGGQPNGDFWTTEEYLLAHLAKVAQGRREGAPAFDFYCMEFWHDPAGDLTRFHPTNFPHGFQRVRDEILKLGMKPGLWIDSGGLPEWTIGRNPAVRGCFTKGDGQGELCRASEPLRSMYTRAFIQLVREHKVGMLKFDNLGPGCGPPRCDNPAHEHLPGPLYSVEAIHNAVIAFLRELDAACPDVFVILYWGYRSPWWLPYADMYFESGSAIEGASPTEFPAAYARDSVTHRLDQAQWQVKDTPWLGKDSLGVWLSDWPWNSCVGKARWQEGLIMDLGRGSLLAQIWTDSAWLSPAERRELADFVALLKANPGCFGHTRFVLGNPLQEQPYGYACTDGQRAFLAIHNASLEDRVVTLKLGPEWGLPDQGSWAVCRWYPRPARLTDAGRPFGRQAAIGLRPHEVTLLEVAPSGGRFSLDRALAETPVATNFAEPSRRLDTTVSVDALPAAKAARWQPLQPLTASAARARLSIREDRSILAGGENADRDVYTVTARPGAGRVTAVLLETLPDDSLPERGPGRAVNGNFMLVDFHMLAEPAARASAGGPAGQPVEVKFGGARADFSQTSYGGWPVSAAIDSSLETGWSIFPQTGRAHAALFELAEPLVVAEGGVLTFKLTQGVRGHGLGRLRLSVTSDASPALPLGYSPVEVVARARLPATRSGGILWVVGDPAQGAPTAMLAGQPVRLDSVWSDRASWSCPWRAWRAEVGSAPAARELGLTFEQPTPVRAPEMTVRFLPTP